SPAGSRMSAVSEVSDPGLDGLETYPVSLRPDVPPERRLGWDQAAQGRSTGVDNSSLHTECSPSHPPNAWRGYVIGVAAGAIVLALTALEAKRTWVAVDPDFLHIEDFHSGSRTIARSDVQSVRALPIDYRLIARSGRVVRIRPVWTAPEMKALAD